MVATASFADIVEQAGNPQQVQLGQLMDQIGGHREVVLCLGLAEAVQKFQQAQGVGVHRIDMEQIVLHQPHRAAELRQVLAENAVAVHTPQLAGDVTRRAHNGHKQPLVAWVFPVVVVNLVAVVTNQPNSIGAYPFDFRMLGHQQEEL